MAIAGPKVQMPSSISQMFEIDEQRNITSIKPEWAAFFHTLQQITYNESRSGPTASRPTASLENRFVGMPYFDTDLGQPIFLKIASSNAWVKADGTPA